MLEILMGIIAGVVSGLGMGGGTILILLLSMFLSIEQHIAQSTNVIFFVPTALAAIFIFVKNKKINYKVGVTICIGGILGSILGASFAINMNVGTLKKYFGIFLIIIGIYQMYLLIKNK